MCGLTGFWAPPGRHDEASAASVIQVMRDRLVHRGPDDHGDWLDPASGIAFGFRRLSIMDLSEAGHQPMLSADGRYVVMLNGEIYNHAELRQRLEQAQGGHAWRGGSDTETLAEAISAWGVHAAISAANGMFALAIWDRQNRLLSLARDRIGKKPLYYGSAGGSFIFGSELKALRAYPDFDPRISNAALSDFLQIGYLAGDRCIYSAISKLPAGHLLQLGTDDAVRGHVPNPECYWNLHGIAMAGLDAQASGHPARQDELEALLEDAVKRRLVADVPVGGFLSGGIDSSLVTAIMAQHTQRPVMSFAIGFHESEWDEAPHARAVAEHLGTEHHELYVGRNDIVDMMRHVAEISDEPLADDSIIPTALVSRLARQQVTVALSGDGGDELFGGYARYAAVEAWLNRAARLPWPVRRAAALVSGRFAWLAARAGQARYARRFNVLASVLGTGDADAVHRMVVSQTLNVGALLANPLAAPHPLDLPAFRLGRSTPVDRMCFMDMASYLTDDILAKVDRASMAASLEVRCPLLDYRVIEMSWRFPPEAKFMGGEGKLPLREMLARHVPRELTDRPKRGFGAPVEHWLRHELRDWGQNLMSEAALSQHGLLRVPACRRLWTDFQEHGHGFNRVIWNVLMFQAWYAASHPPGGPGDGAELLRSAPR